MVVERESNIELLRIIATCSVIILHYINPLCGGGWEYASVINRYVLLFLECLSVNAVNVFCIITGFFLCKKNDRSFIKPLEMLVQVIVVNEAYYIISAFLGYKSFSLKSFILYMIPNNWFVLLYIALYIISPLLNILWDKIQDARLEKKVIIVLFIVFLLYPTIVDLIQEVSGLKFDGLSTIGAYGSEYGYTIVNFVVMYFIGAFIRNCSIKPSSYRIIVYVLLLFIWAIIEQNVPFIEMAVWEYCNPVVVLLAIEEVLLFKEFKIGTNRFINYISRASFMVYLIHWYVLPHLSIEYFVKQSTIIMLIHLLVSVIAIYFFCIFIWEVYSLIMKRVYKYTLWRIPFLKKDIYKGL